MARHGLAQRAPATAAMGVVERLCGLHAQVMSSAELTLWARVDGLQRDLLSRALWADRTLVKTWSMRGTLHLLPAHEYGLWQAGFSTYDHFTKPAWSRAFGLTVGELDALIEAVGASLRGRVLTRDALAAAVAERTDAATGEKVRESWGAVLKPASFRGELVFGPSHGRNVRFAHPADQVGDIERVEPGDALARITRRYLALNGPATRDDLRRWWGVQAPHAGRMLTALGDEAVRVRVAGEERWLLAADVDELAAAAPDGRTALVPAFDQYVAGAPRGVDALLPAGMAGRVYRPQGWLSPVLLVDGRMAGVWRHEVKGGRVRVAIEPFARPPRAVRQAAEAEAGRLAGWLGGELELTWP